MSEASRLTELKRHNPTNSNTKEPNPINPSPFQKVQLSFERKTTMGALNILNNKFLPFRLQFVHARVVSFFFDPKKSRTPSLLPFCWEPDSASRSCPVQWRKAHGPNANISANRSPWYSLSLCLEGNLQRMGEVTFRQGGQANAHWFQGQADANYGLQRIKQWKSFCTDSVRQFNTFQVLIQEISTQGPTKKLHQRQQERQCQKKSVLFPLLDKSVVNEPSSTAMCWFLSLAPIAMSQSSTSCYQRSHFA